MSRDAGVLNRDKTPTMQIVLDGDTNIRSAEIFSQPQILPDWLDKDVLERAVNLVRIDDRSSERSIGATAHSYVILAACRKGQKAHEIRYGDSKPGQWRGLFTVALLEELRGVQAFKSYYDLIRQLSPRMKSLANHKQEPKCRGADGFHRLFTHHIVGTPNPRGKVRRR